MVLHIIFISLACFFNSVMDALENENFSESIFRDWKKSFWYKRESWKTAVRIFGYKVDGWHLAKSLMIICFVLAAGFLPDGNNMLFVLLVDGVVWNLLFNLFYHKIFGIR